MTVVKAMMKMAKKTKRDFISLMVKFIDINNCNGD